MERATKIADWKKQEVEDIKSLIKNYNVLGIVDITNLPSLQLKRIRKQLKDSIFVKISKKRLIKIALNELDNKDLKLIGEQIAGMPAIIFSRENPFKLYRLLNKNKSSAPAKQGQTAPKDIIVQAGPTSFAPGPIISELNQVGLKTEVKEGKINIKEDRLLVKKGDKINAKTASILSKLGIEPMEVGLNLILAYDNVLIFARDILAIDETMIKNNIKKINSSALGLALYISYINKETIRLFLKKAYSESTKLAKFKNIPISKEKVEIETNKTNDRLEDIKLSENNKKEIEKEAKIEEKPKKEKKPLKYFKEKGPSSSEILKEVEKEIKAEQNKPDKKANEDKKIKEMERIAQDILRGNINP